MNEVLELTIPQLHIMSKNLAKIAKQEAGKGGEEKSVEEVNGSYNDQPYLANRKAFGNTIKILKERTGKQSFTQKEVLNPEETIKKYKKLKEKQNGRT